MSNQDPWYRQCRYETVETPRKIGVSWIPEHGAVVGKKIRLLDAPDPDEVWVVREVWARARRSEVVARQHDYRHQRKASDV